MKAHKEHSIKILLVGGGTGGPTVPVLAVGREVKVIEPNTSLLMVGPGTGPEIMLAKEFGVPFRKVYAGKLRRYWSLWNFLMPFQVVYGFFQSLVLVKQFKPDCVFGAGGFAQVPVMYAARLCGVPVVCHQQDIAPTLSNKICAPIASKISVAFEQGIADFPQGISNHSFTEPKKVVHTGNPVRPLENIDKDRACKRLGLKKDVPVILVMGGGTGARAINELVGAGLEKLLRFCQVIHLTGGKVEGIIAREGYKSFSFLSDMSYVYAAADVVVSRAGLSSIAELIVLGKPAVIIPIPNSHQEQNARYLEKEQAAIVLDQAKLNSEDLVKVIESLLQEPVLLKRMTKRISDLMPHNAATRIAEIVHRFAKAHESVQ